MTDQTDRDVSWTVVFRLDSADEWHDWTRNHRSVPDALASAEVLVKMPPVVEIRFDRITVQRERFSLADLGEEQPAVSAGQAPTDRAAALSEAERAMLTYALDQAQERIWSEDGFTDEDQAAVDSLRRMAAEPATTGHADDGTSTHTYLSTGCLHGEHGYCQSMTGLNGAKWPGECKFCAAPCVCPCHADGQPAVVSPPADRAALRDRIAEALLDHLSRTADIRPSREGALAFMPEVTDPERMRITEAVLAVLPAPDNQTTALEAERDSLGREADRLRAELRRLAGEEIAHCPKGEPHGRHMWTWRQAGHECPGVEPADRAAVLRSAALLEGANAIEGLDPVDGPGFAALLRRLAGEARPGMDSGELELAGPKFKETAENLNTAAEAQQDGAQQ